MARRLRRVQGVVGREEEMARIYWRNGIAWARATRGGTEYRVSLKTASAKVADQEFARWLSKLDAQIRRGEKPDHTFDEAATKFIDEHLPTIKPRSADRYIVSIANLTRTFEGMDLEKITSAALNDFVSMRRADRVPPPPNKKPRQAKDKPEKPRKLISSPTIRRDLACLSSIFGMAIEWEWIEVNPVGPFLRRMKRRNLKESSARTRYLSVKEEIALLDNAAPYVADAIRFAIDTGLRKEEQFSREWSHIDLARNEITILGSTSKNAKDRRVPMMPRAREIVEALPRDEKLPAVFWHRDKLRRRKPRRFLTMDRGLKAAARRAGISDLRWHDLRRTCGCRLLQDRGLSIEQVSKWLGHSSIAVTERAYAFLNVEHLHRALARPRLPEIEPPTIDGNAS